MQTSLNWFVLLGLLALSPVLATPSVAQASTASTPRRSPQPGDADYSTSAPSQRHTEKVAPEVVLIPAPNPPPGPELSPVKVALWPENAPIGDGTFEKADPTITVYRAPKPNGAAVVICPGGGYGGLVTGPEGTGIAQWLNRHGITGIVLEYRLPRGRAFVPLLDAQRAVRIVRARAAAWGCDPRRIGIMGFSAGGHLAATVATHFDAGEPTAVDPVERVSCRPDFAVLVYPVISMGELTHGGSKQNLLGANPTAEAVASFSNEQQVTAATPPTFLTHAQDDKAVSPEQSRRFYQALQAQKVPARYLELPSGGHGLNGYQGPMWDAWQTGVLEWLAELNLIPGPAVATP